MARYISASHDKSIIVAEYIADDGSKLLKQKGTISWRFNNPGNLRPASKTKHTGQIGVGDTKSGKFSIFESYEEGRKAKKSLLLRVYSSDTIPSMMERYAPRSENDTDAYINHLINKTGFSRAIKVSDLTSQQLDSLMDAMQVREGYKAGTETIVPAVNVTLSDGAKPIANEPVKVEVNDKIVETQTNDYGQIPKVGIPQVGDKVVLKRKNSQGEWEEISTIVVKEEGNNHLFCRETQEYKAHTSEHKTDKTYPVTKNAVRYVVQPKDTLTKIATKFNTIAGQIQSDNKLSDPNKIYPGQVLWLGGKTPAGQSTGTTAKKPEPKKYTIQPGDTLGKVASKFGTTVEKIQADNKISNPNKIYPGQVLVINSGSSRGSTSAPKPAPKPKPKPAPQTTTPPVSRTKEGAGSPIATIPLDQKRAPWMVAVVRELIQWYGIKEGSITDNYHELVGVNYANMVGSNRAWCASFANYCLKNTGYSMVTTGDSYDRIRALGFTKDKVNFKKIDTPVYGAIGVRTRSGGGHVVFVYGISTINGEFLALGGNQSDALTIMSTTQSIYSFYVPTPYLEYAKSDKLIDTMSVNDAYQKLGLVAVESSGKMS